MFERIIIKNFQSHKKTILRLAPGINGIIGKPNSGKTAIIRSILLLKNNRPSGYSFHNNFSDVDKPTEVAIKPDNYPILKIKKLKKTAKSGVKTKYQFKKETLDVGKNIPIEISSALNVDDINFALQLGLPYLALSTPSEVAREINKVTESEVINKCIKETNDRLNKLKSKRSTLSNRVDELTRTLAPYKNLSEAKPIINMAKKMDAAIEKNEEHIESLQKTEEFIRTSEKMIKNEKKPLKALPLIQKAEKIQSKIEKISAKITLLQKVEMIADSISRAKKEKKTLVAKYIQALKENKSCPICFAPINTKTINRLKGEISK